MKLIPFAVIKAAKMNDIEAAEAIKKQYEGFIASLCLQSYEDENGKPLAKNGVCFNLSHSGEYVAFAVGGAQVGCDIEKLKITLSENIVKKNMIYSKSHPFFPLFIILNS